MALADPDTGNSNCNHDRNWLKSETEMLKYATILLGFIVLAGCASGGRDSRSVGSIADPFCAPDGSVVYVQYADSQGNFNEMKASRENCSWNKK